MVGVSGSRRGVEMALIATFRRIYKAYINEYNHIASLAFNSGRRYISILVVTEVEEVVKEI